MLRRLLNTLGWLGTALVVAAVAVRVLQPANTEVWRGLAIAGLVCVLLYLASQWREIGRTFSRRQARYGALTGLSVLLVLAILAGINYLSARHNTRWDLTANQVYSLSEQTRKVVGALDRPLKVLVFDRNDSFSRFRDRLTEYEEASPQVSVEYVDVDRQPARAREYEIQSYGTIVLEYDGRRERVTSDSEQDLTNAIVKVVQGREQKAYFTTGHGERDPVSADERSGYNAIADALRRDNFQVETLVLAQRGAVPADASVVIVAGPTMDFLPVEIEVLRKYLDAGGKALFLLDPPEGAGSRPLAGLTSLVREWGFDLGDNVVLDPVSQALGTGASAPVAASFPPHPITDRFRALTAFPLVRAVGPVAGGVDGRIPQVFVETSPESFAKTDLSVLSAGGEVAFDEARDRKGPISVAAAISMPAPSPPPDAAPGATGKNGGKTGGSAGEGAGDEGAAGEGAGDDADKPSPPETRMAVIGDSDFASNGVLGIPGNADLFMNTVNWLAQQETLIAIRAREPEDRRVALTPLSSRLTLLTTLLLVPGLIFLAGAYTWWRRR